MGSQTEGEVCQTARNDDSNMYLPKNAVPYEQFISKHHRFYDNSLVFHDVYGSEQIPRSQYSLTNAKSFNGFQRNTCFICQRPSFTSEKLTRCSKKSCSSSYHKSCLPHMNFGGFTEFHATSNQGFECPLHHCQKCFADGLHHRCFRYTELIRCQYCHFGYHQECIPAGCATSSEDQIVCPRHLLMNAFPLRLSNHCFECFDNPLKSNQALIDCSNCFRSFHPTCHSVHEYQPGDSNGERCSFCIRSNFVISGNYVYAVNSESQFELGLVVPIHEYPQDLPAVKPGNFVIRWAGKDYGIASHYMTIAFDERIWFYAHASMYPNFMKIKPEDYVMIKRAMEFKSAPEKYASYTNFRNNVVKIVENNKYSTAQMRKQLSLANKVHVLDICTCPKGQPNRCAGFDCFNRNAFYECPISCQCLNRLELDKARYSKHIEIFYTDGCGFGVRTKVPIPAGSFVGELCGEIITQEEFNKRKGICDRWGSRDAAFYYMDFDSVYLDAQHYGSIMRYANHSCDPNCLTQRFISSIYDTHICLYARKDIEAGEEITFSYAAKSDINNGRFLCKCGSNNCKGEFFA